MNRIKQYWENYAAQYPHRWQWWVSGLIYGLFIGKQYAEVKQTQKTWDKITFEHLRFIDAAWLTFDLKWADFSIDDVTMWLLNRGYTFPSTEQLTENFSSPFGDLTTDYSIIAQLIKKQLDSVDCGPGDEKCEPDPNSGEMMFCPNHYDTVMRDAH